MSKRTNSSRTTQRQTKDATATVELRTAEVAVDGIAVDHVTAGYAPGDQISVKFTRSRYYIRERALVRGALCALRRQGARLKTGKLVNSHGDVLVYVLERMAEGCRLPLELDAAGD
jgi:hypothetical protein